MQLLYVWPRNPPQHMKGMQLTNRRIDLLVDTIENSNMMQTLRVINLTNSQIRNVGGKRLAALVAADTYVKGMTQLVCIGGSAPYLQQRRAKRPSAVAVAWFGRVLKGARMRGI